jgi:hypothetical protein
MSRDFQLWVSPPEVLVEHRPTAARPYGVGSVVAELQVMGPKQVSTNEYFIVFGSSIPIWRAGRIDAQPVIPESSLSVAIVRNVFELGRVALDQSGFFGGIHD